MSIADIRVGLVAYLYADSAISALVGGGVARSAGGKRIFPVKLPQGVVLPSIVYSRISGQGDHHMEGPSGLNRVRMQIDCYAQDEDTPTTLANLVKERIDGFGPAAMEWDENSPGNAVFVQGIFFDSEREDWDQEAELYRVSRDYLIWFKELV